MGLFDKKYCSICGNQIKLLSNRKLEDGDMCKECARKLSPWFSDRKHSTVEAIKEQLDYRAANERKLGLFNPTKTVGEYYKFYIDETNKQFIVTSASKWREGNPDIIKFSDVLNISLNIDEDKDEIFKEDNDGNQVSYNPPKYEYEYDFNLHLDINNKFFDEIDVVINSQHAENPGDKRYMYYLEMCKEIAKTICDKELFDDRSGFDNTSHGNEKYSDDNSENNEFWYCRKCGTKNSGEYCIKCGDKKPYIFEPFYCSKCGYKIEVPSIDFCPKCGNKVK